LPLVDRVSRRSRRFVVGRFSQARRAPFLVELMCYAARMRFAVLSSGSKGNAILVEGGGARILVDCGLQPKSLRERLALVDRSLTDIDAVVVTHGHGDHVAGARVLAGAFRLLTYATQKTHKFLGRTGGVSHLAPITPDETFRVGALEITPFSTPHDAPGSVGFVFTDGDARFAVCTDLGHVTSTVTRALRDLDALYLEFNHDFDMLKNGPYPMPLKRRIGSPLGHLSNDEARGLLKDVHHNEMRHLVLAHLSESNNTPTLAMHAARSITDGSKTEIAVAPQHTAMDFIDVRATSSRRAPAVAAPRRDHVIAALGRKVPARSTSVAVGRQLALFGASSGTGGKNT
jgi:phosphoribosyl 1,2-cyclic phosphodiesterase